MAISNPPYRESETTNWELEITQAVNLNEDKLISNLQLFEKMLEAIQVSDDFTEFQERMRNL
jgi:hypothetical protein